MQEWYVTAGRARVDWAVAVVGLVPAIDIYRLVRHDHGGEQVTRWARAGVRLSPWIIYQAKLAEASSPVPAPLIEGDPLPPGYGQRVDLSGVVRRNMPDLALTALQQLGVILVQDDGSPNSGWPDRLAFEYNDGAGHRRRTGYFNEYGELRSRQAKRGTVAFRVQEHPDGSLSDILQVTDTSNAGVYFGVSPTAAQFGVPVRAPNISVDAVRVVDSAPINASTTVVADTSLSVQLEANSTYIIEGIFVYDCSQAADLKLQFQTAAAVSLCSIAMGALTASATSNTNSINVARRTNNASFSLGGGAVGTPVTADFRGVVVTGTTATPLTLAYAQNTSEASDLVVKAGSHLSARKVRAA